MSQKKGTVFTETRLLFPQRETRKFKLEVTTADTEVPVRLLHTSEQLLTVSPAGKSDFPAGPQVLNQCWGWMDCKKANGK